MPQCQGLGQATLTPGHYLLVSVDEESDDVEPRAKLSDAKGSFSPPFATLAFVTIKVQNCFLLMRCCIGFQSHDVICHRRMPRD